MGVVRVDPHEKWYATWNTYGRNIRYFVCLPEAIGFGLLAIACLCFTLFSSSHYFIDDWSLYFIVGYGALAEIGLLGFLWVSNCVRVLPYWGAQITPSLSLQPASSFLFKHQRINNLLVGLLVALLIGSLITPSLILPTSIIFAFLALCDLWRIFYFNYCLFAITTFLFPHPHITIQIILASIYLWSGFGKLVMPVFYREIAPLTFKHIYSLIDRCASPFGLSENALSKIHIAAAIVGVLQEFLMGIVLFVPHWFPSYILNATLIFNLFMHFYIVIFIGLANNIHTFICWNMWCTLLTQIVFSPSLCGSVLSTEWHAFHYFTLFVMNVFPILMFFGRCIHGTLCHAYFAPGWYGHILLLLPIRAVGRLPKFVNGQDLRYYSYLHSDDAYYSVLKRIARYIPTSPDSTTLVSEMRRAFLLEGETEEETRDIPLATFLESRCVIVDDSWFDCTFNYGQGDPAQEYYGPGHPSFWRTVVAEVLPEERNNAFVFLQNEFSILHKGFYSSYVLKL